MRAPGAVNSNLPRFCCRNGRRTQAYLKIICKKQRDSKRFLRSIVTVLCNSAGKDRPTISIMKFKGMGVIALFLFFSIENFGEAWAQNVAAANDVRHVVPIWSTQPMQVQVVAPQLTDFERYGSHADQPLVALTFPAISADLGPNVSLSLTPRGLTPFDAPDALKALAVEFRLSQSLPATRGTELSQSHSVATLLDFDELPAFRSLFNSLAVTGMPRQPFSDAKAVVRMASKTGMRLEFTAQRDGRILLVVATEVDSVTISLDADSARRWVDAFTAARRALDVAADTR